MKNTVFTLGNVISMLQLPWKLLSCHVTILNLMYTGHQFVPSCNFIYLVKYFEKTARV